MRSKFSLKFLGGLEAATLFALLALLLLPSAVYAQSTGTVLGTITDPTGAVIPDAKITLTNSATNDKRDTISNGTGYFSFASVPPGTYAIKVSASGFKPAETKGIALRPADVLNIPVSLKIGSETEAVEVVDVAGEIHPVDSGELSSTLTSKQISNLSLEGRDATELIRTLPGFSAFNGGSINNQGQDFTVISPTGGAVGEGVVSGGSTYRGGTDLTMDGAHILDNGCNCGATQTVNGDTVAEVKVQTSNFGADSAKGPVVVNVVGKSGTTDYHGGVRLYARDQSLNALDWSFKRQLVAQGPNGLLQPPPSRFMYPGGSFSGPVPGTNKKVVFTTDFEYYYQSGIPLAGLTTSGLLTDSLPTLSMRAGDFSSTAADNAALCTGIGAPNVYQPVCADLGTGFTYHDPNTNTNVTGTASSAQLPTSLFDPGAAILLNNVPLPNADPVATGGYNYIQPENLNQNGWMFRTRVDYNISDKSKLYVTYNTQKETDNVPVHLWWEPTNSIPFPGGMSSKDDSQTISGHFLRVFSPTLTNDTTVALGYINYPLVRNDKNAWSLAGNSFPYQGVYSTNTTMMPQIGNGYWIAGIPQMIQPDIFENGGHFVWEKWNFSLEDAVTKVYKTHTIKSGFYWEKTVNNQGAFSDLNGNWGPSQGGPFSCNDGTITCGASNPVADMLMGIGSYDQVTKSALDNLWYPTYSGYVQDDWKVAKRLTLNLGLRADHLGAWRPPSGSGVATFLGDFSNTVSGIPGYAWTGVDSSLPVTGRNVPTLTWEPRLGMAYDLFGTGKTVLRGGWGEYGYRDQWNDYGGPADLAQGVTTYTAPRPYTLAYVNQLGVSGAVSPTSGGCGASPLPQCGSTSGLLLTDDKQPITRNYNFTISQQLPWSSLLEIGYVGSTSLYGPLEGNTNNLDARNMNVIQTGALFSYVGCSSPLSPTDTNCDINRNGTPVGAFPLSALFGNANVQTVQHLAKANYNGLQTSWVRQKGRVTYNLNYTWSKALGTQGTAQLNGLAPDALSLAHDYGVLSIDRSNVFNFSYTFQTGNPFHGNPVLRYALNGWNLSGITTWQSGPDITTLANQNLGLGGNGPASPVGGTDAMYAITAVNYLGTNNSSLQPTVTCNPTAGLKAHQYFNASCFSVPTAGSNGWWQLPYLHGPAYFNSDLAVFKTFKVTERQNLEFRFSAFNFLNHPLDSFQNNGDMSISYNYVGNGCGASGQVGCALGAGSYVLTSPVTATSPGQAIHAGYASTKFGRRVLELSAKYNF